MDVYAIQHHRLQIGNDNKTNLQKYVCFTSRTIPITTLNLCDPEIPLLSTNNEFAPAVLSCPIPYTVLHLVEHSQSFDTKHLVC